MLSLHLLLGLPRTRFLSLGVHSDVVLAHLVLLILTTCHAHCPLMHRTLHYIFHPCFRYYLIPNLVSLCDVYRILYYYRLLYSPKLPFMLPPQSDMMPNVSGLSARPIVCPLAHTSICASIRPSSIVCQ